MKLARAFNTKTPLPHFFFFRSWPYPPFDRITAAPVRPETHYRAAVACRHGTGRATRSSPRGGSPHVSRRWEIWPRARSTWRCRVLGLSHVVLQAIGGVEVEEKSTYGTRGDVWRWMKKNRSNEGFVVGVEAIYEGAASSPCYAETTQRVQVMMEALKGRLVEDLGHKLEARNSCASGSCFFRRTVPRLQCLTGERISRNLDVRCLVRQSLAS